MYLSDIKLSNKIIYILTRTISTIEQLRHHGIVWYLIGDNQTSHETLMLSLIDELHETNETCHSITFYFMEKDARVNSHQR